MDLADFGDGPAYAVGLSFCLPPRYACFRETPPSGWMWTTDLLEAETFRTEAAARRHLEGDMAALVGGNEDVEVLRIEMKVSAVAT